jgi:hypothetical protein
MATATRATAVYGDLVATASATASFTIPATVEIGDVICVVLSSGTSTVTMTTVPSGWTLKDTNIASTLVSFFACHTVASLTERSTTVSFGMSATSRLSGAMSVTSGGTETGMIFAKLGETSAVSTPALPSLASVPAGAMLNAFWTRRLAVASSSANITVNAAYSQLTPNRAGTNFSNSPNTSAEVAHRIVSTAGTYGGETSPVVTTAGGASASALGTNYLIAIPEAAAAATGRVVDKWNGTALVRQRVDKWNGTALVLQKNDV